MTEKQPHARETLTNNAIAELYRRKLITKEQEGAARTLFRSCRSAYERAGNPKKRSYLKIKFKFENALDMTVKVITLKIKMWEKWQEQQVIYDSRDDENDHKQRATLDRINRKGHYSLSNIRMKSHIGNYTDASNRRRKPVAIMVVENGELSFKTVVSLTAAQKELDVSSTKLNRMKLQPYDLAIKNEAGDLINTGKQIFAMASYTVTRSKFLQMEIERLEEDKAEYEPKGVNMDFINEKIASYKEQIADPVAMKAGRDRRDKADYIRTVGSIARFEAMSVDKVDAGLLAGLRQKKMILEANGYHLL
ncbi:hypothetical protein V6B14_08530 [Sporosarcina psychrophila]|uniref:hypothetical protein n=1 Tax=Sporosarcina psychrophila TaxID=1476 RepID=UPI0030CEC410